GSVIRDDASHLAGRTVLRPVAPPPAPVAVPRRRESDRRRSSERAPFVVAHRGASGVLPEHTLPAFARAIALGADAVEVDIVATADGRLVARHEPELAATTNAPEREDRLAAVQARGAQIDDASAICTHDLTLRDLTRLRARQRWPHRPLTHDDLFMVPSLAQVLGLVRRSRTKDDRVPALHIELKDPARHAELGVPLERELVRDLAAHGWNRPDAPVLVQCFEADALLLLAGRTSVPLLQLARLDDEGLARCTDRGLEAISTYAVGIGVSRELLAEVGPELFARAHARGLVVHVYTFADDDPLDPDPAASYDLALRLGADALITDFVDSGVRARDRWLAAEQRS
ncbi:MAG: glycerophosphodiester phosphodiesterase family protein, partial [Solirubrobacteraceae bacterium]|nr:glycerophosphodiester phosphodiesterase family protein [Patulibacter sp.]